MSDGFSAQVLRDLKRRSGGVCEGCGVEKATQAHHRQYRSRGGSDDLDNALHLCGSGNHTGCHGKAHTAQGEADGWSIRSGFDPAIVPALIVVGFVRRWVRFNFAEFPTLMNDSDALEYMFAIHARKATA